jgi:hypothetical protein
MIGFLSPAFAVGRETARHGECRSNDAHRQSEVIMGRKRSHPSREATPPGSVPKQSDTAKPPEHPEDQPNPPHTTTRRMTSPKFGSAGSGGLELEPGPERD